MDIALLKTFLAVARARHFGKAADTLFVTQSAVSARIKLLEANLGVELFNRRRNDIQLTTAGMRLVRHAETIVKGWDRARNEVALDTQGGESLAVGCPFDLWGILLREWVTSLRRRSPQLDLTVEVQPAEGLVGRLVNGLLDLVILFEPPQLPDLDIRQIADVALILVAGRPGLSTAAAMTDNYVMVDWGNVFAQIHAANFPDSAPPTARSSSGMLALDILLTTGGSAYLAERMVQQHIDEGVLFRVDDAPVINRSAFAVYQPENARRAFIEKVVENLSYIADAGDKQTPQNQLVHMRQLAFHDFLTGLANRALFREQLVIAMARAERREELLAVLMMDLDGFKIVNDRLGHNVGDAVLQQVAQRVNLLVRRSDILARVGGDEFVLLINDIKSAKAAEDVAQKMMDAVAAPIELEAEAVTVGCCIGIAYYPFEAVDLDTLIHQADVALYEAKAEGKNRCVCYQRRLQHSRL